MATSHLYLPLGVNEIRLVILKPSPNFEEKVTCTLVHRSLDSETPFEALSYTWGDASSRQFIILNGRKHPITNNLNTALRHLRYTQDQRIIWIDALSINQDDIPERNQQVTQMRLIYKRAVKVVVWLGPASYNTDLAFKFLFQASLKKQEITNWIFQTFKSSDGAEQWEALLDLVNRDYWKRVWIIQEIFSAGAVIVRCGFRCIRWSNYILLFISILNQPQFPVQVMLQAGNLIKLPFIRTIFASITDNSLLPVSIERHRMVSQRGGELSLERLLHGYWKSLSRDSRDKVFALIGIAEEYNDDQCALKIDYSLSTRETYIETVRCLIERAKRSEKCPLSFICHSFPQFSQENLPSWVPDWSAQPTFHLDTNAELWKMSCIYNSDRGSPPDPKIRIDGGVLTVQGLEIATVDHLGSAPVPIQVKWAVDAKLATVTKFRNIIAIFQAACKLAISNSEGLPHCHKPLDERKEDLARTLLCNHNNILDSPKYPAPGEVIDEIYDAMDSIKSERSMIEYMVNKRTSLDASNNLLGAFNNLFLFRFCVSSAGSFLMVPPLTRKGDQVCVLFGYNIPVVLRKKGKTQYVYVGECYAHGIMQGEAIEDLADGKYTITEFHIS